jgi:hypothetical protein
MEGYVAEPAGADARHPSGAAGDMSATPSRESVRKARAAAREEEAFWQEHYQRFLEQYPDQFLAVTKQSGHVVAADPDLNHLIDKIAESGLDVGQVWVRFLVHTPLHIAL